MTAAKQSSVVEQNQAIATYKLDPQQIYRQQNQLIQSELGQSIAGQTIGGLQSTLTVGNAIPQAQSYNMATLTTTKR